MRAPYADTCRLSDVRNAAVASEDYSAQSCALGLAFPSGDALVQLDSISKDQFSCQGVRRRAPRGERHHRHQGVLGQVMSGARRAQGSCALRFPGKLEVGPGFFAMLFDMGWWFDDANTIVVMVVAVARAAADFGRREDAAQGVHFQDD